MNQSLKTALITVGILVGMSQFGPTRELLRGGNRYFD